MVVPSRRFKESGLLMPVSNALAIPLAVLLCVLSGCTRPTRYARYDADAPAAREAGVGRFYVVTRRLRLGEDGTYLVAGQRHPTESWGNFVGYLNPGTVLYAEALVVARPDPDKGHPWAAVAYRVAPNDRGLDPLQRLGLYGFGIKNNNPADPEVRRLGADLICRIEDEAVRPLSDAESAGRPVPHGPVVPPAEFQGRSSVYEQLRLLRTFTHDAVFDGGWPVMDVAAQQGTP